MTGRGVIRLVLLGFVVVALGFFVARETGNKETDATDAVQAAADGRQVTVYYFHRTARCATCLKIEEQSQNSVAANFAEQLKRGDLVFKSVNVETEGNEHFVDDYQLVSQALVVVDYRDGVQEKWKNLDQVWNLVHTDDAFNAYVRDEVQIFLASI